MAHFLKYQYVIYIYTVSGSLELKLKYFDTYIHLNNHTENKISTTLKE
jgi:hypothetical protein